MLKRAAVVAVLASLFAVSVAVAVAAPAEALPDPAYRIVRAVNLPSTGAGVSLTGAGVAVDPSRGLVYVAGRHSNQVWVYDEATLTLQATIPVPNQPFTVAVGPTGFLYVSEYTGNNVPGSVAVINPTTRAVVATVPVGNSPVGVTVSKDGTRLWVGNNSSTFVSVLDLTNPAAPAVLPALTLPGTSELVTEGPTGLLYVATNNNSVFVVNPATGSTVATWTGRATAHQVMISADGTHAFVSQQSGSSAAIFDLGTNTASGSIPVASTYYQSTDPTLGVDFITAPWEGVGSILVVDSTTGALSQTLQGIPMAYYAATDPVTHRTFVTSITSPWLTEVAPSPPVVTGNPVDQTVAEGGTASFSAVATSAPPMTVQWQVSTDGGGIWSDVAGATAATLTVRSATMSQSRDQYRAVFTNPGGTATTTAAILTVTPSPVIPPPSGGGAATSAGTAATNAGATVNTGGFADTGTRVATDGTTAAFLLLLCGGTILAFKVRPMKRLS